MSCKKALIPAALIFLGTAAPTLAQVVGSIGSLSGDVVVTRGSTNYAAQSSGSLMGGDCVTALPDASSLISLANGCTFTVEPGQSVIVNAGATTCANAFSTPAAACYAPPTGGVSSNVGAGSGGQVGAGAGGAGITGTAGTIAGLPLLPVAAGLAVIAGAVVIATDGDDEPASP